MRQKTADVDLWLSDPFDYSIDIDDPAALAEMRRRVHKAEFADGITDADAVNGLRALVEALS